MVADRSQRPVGRSGSSRPADLTSADARWLFWHEARSHALLSREVVDLEDAWLLHDETDREPFWNRLVGVAWPNDTAAFDHRLAEALALFAGLDRIPHVWPLPGFDDPPDLVARLRTFGFDDHGGGLFLVLDPDRSRLDTTIPPADDGALVTVERLHRLSGPVAEAGARGLAEVLVGSFDVEPERRVAVELEALQGLTNDAYHAVLVRVDGRPAAVARRTTFAGASYLSSIGTAPAFQGRGLGRLVTSIVAADALTAGSRWVYLGVFEENHVARRLYRSLGFEQVGGIAPDLILGR